MELSTAGRNNIIHFLLQHMKDGKVIRGKIGEAAIKYGVSTRTVSKLWAAARKQQENNESLNSISGRKFYVRRRKIAVDLERIQSIPFSKRATIRALAGGINVQKSTAHRWVKAGLIIPHTSAIKPDLKAMNKMQRLKFALEALEFQRDEGVLKFKTMQNTVHVDEKWFQITKTVHRYYLTPGETEPIRTCRSKKFIKKIMFIAAVSRPIFNEDGSLLFDGKIGIFPFTEMVPAKRRSKNREAGTLEMQPIPSITMPVMRRMFLNQIVPNIKAKWPEGVSKVIYIQQDNARPHIKDDDPEFRAIASSDGFDIRIVHQPPNSPDMNINDLGWFRAIQAIQHESVCYTTRDLVIAVQDSFEQLEAPKLNKVFLTLQSCMLEVMKVKGGNNYKIPHIKKDHLDRQGLLPITLEAAKDLVQECVDFLIEHGGVDGLEELIEQLALEEDNADA